MPKLNLPSPLQQLSSPLFDSKSVTVYVKREDLIHPIIGGNKWRKLKYNIHEIETNNQQTVLSFGGAYSNHIYALAGAGNIYGFNTIGIIRGERHEPLNPTLEFANKMGMQLHYVSREAYRRKESDSFIAELKDKFGQFILLPEGGSNQHALRGCAEIMDELDEQLEDCDYVCLPCGTAGTLSGLISSQTKKRLLAIAVLKNAGFLRESVNELLPDNKGVNWTINLDYHFNGYAKKTPELTTFISDFKREFNIPLEPVYSGKLFYGLIDLIQKDYFPRGTKIVALHTGGLQNSKDNTLS